jgi:hypothetical protein
MKISDKIQIRKEEHPFYDMYQGTLMLRANFAIDKPDQDSVVDWDVLGEKRVKEEILYNIYKEVFDKLHKMYHNIEDEINKILPKYNQCAVYKYDILLAIYNELEELKDYIEEKEDI